MTDYLADARTQLAERLPCGYARQAMSATEPTALACLALAAHGDLESARPGLNWLVKQQSTDGSLGIAQNQSTPCWPTGLAILAWMQDQAGYTQPFDRAVAWLLEARGNPQPRSAHMGHDSTLVGWPWVIGTHSWIEPTAWNVLALKAAGHRNHPRTREAVRLLIDRLLSGGGSNYGNTFVLGQELRPHLQPAGLTVLALADERLTDERFKRSVTYLEREISERTTAASLSYALLGLGAVGRFPAVARPWLEAAAEHAVNIGDPLRMALVCLAARAEQSPLMPVAQPLAARQRNG